MSQSAIPEQRTIFPFKVDHSCVNGKPDFIEQCNYCGLTRFFGWNEYIPDLPLTFTVAIFRVKWKAVDKSP